MLLKLPVEGTSLFAGLVTGNCKLGFEIFMFLVLKFLKLRFKVEGQLLK
jgi:hypothetical protein